MIIRSAKELDVYDAAFRLAMEIFVCSRSWPKEELYSLTDQIRRSSRSVCVNLQKAWAKRAYRADFLIKLTDSDAENSETETWLGFALACGYIAQDDHEYLTAGCSKIGAMLGSMLKNPDPFLNKEYLTTEYTESTEKKATGSLNF
jgi:four helix bundle protein